MKMYMLERSKLHKKAIRIMEFFYCIRTFINTEFSDYKF